MAKYATYASMNKVKKEVESPDVVEIKSARERNNLIKSNLLVVIDNYAPWCGPCKLVSPHYSKIASEYTLQGKCILAKEDVDNHFENEQEVTGVPCFHFYVNGEFQEEMTITGAAHDKVRKQIHEVLQNFGLIN
jgi:thiol-disulfide isomerase/thioredoxin